jgi:hypothetical protein
VSPFPKQWSLLILERPNGHYLKQTGDKYSKSRGCKICIEISQCLYLKNAEPALSAGFELSYEWFHLFAGVVEVVFGVLGGFYALKALMALYRSPEMLKTQRNIWLPILIGGVFFIVSGLFHFAKHSYFLSLDSSSEMNLLRDSSSVIGFSLLTIGIVRYSQLQIKYYRLKQEALQKISEKHKQ